EIQPPMANRLWHGEFPMDHQTWCDMMVSDFPAPADLPLVPHDYLHKHHHRQRATIAGYVKAAGHDAWMAPPDDVARRSGPWEAAMIALGVAGKKNADIPAAAARKLCDRANRPGGRLKLPEECRPFYELMRMAKLVPSE